MYAFRAPAILPYLNLSIHFLTPVSDILKYFISMPMVEDWEREWFKDVIGMCIQELYEVKDFLLST